ncbi:MAG: hydantoinase/oxoprolinase family protein [Steroidobacteraceae bacterium]
MPKSTKKYVIAVDSGGTFADCVVMDDAGSIRTGKAPSTPEDFSTGVVDSVARVAQDMGTSADDLLQRLRYSFCHGGTAAINALLTRSGVKVGLLTTKGFEDTLAMGRVDQKIAGLSEAERIQVHRLNKAEPIVPRHLIKGLVERVDSKGHEVVALNHDDACRQIDALAAEGVGAIAICLLWSFLDPTHEREVRRLVRERHPGIFVCSSSELAPVIGEYERMTTAVINAYPAPITSRYLTSLHRKLQARGLTHPLLIMQNGGGTVDVAEALNNAVNLLASGPVGGVLAAKKSAELRGYTNVIATDVGGTSFDVGLIVDGGFEYTYNPVFSQYRLHAPIIDIKSIGAGGGSIAWIEEKTGLLKVGPKSAGAQPGPVCYGRGGEQPTVTDANLALGRIDPENFLGGRMQLDKRKAVAALQEKIAAPMGLTVEQAAFGIIEITTAQMADLVRKVTIDKGYDPGQFVLYSYGGAGPLCCFLFAPQIGGVREVVVPANSSVFSALGMAYSDIVQIERFSMPMRAPFDIGRVRTIFQELEATVMDGLRRNGIAPPQMALARSVGARFWGQVHELAVPLTGSTITQTALQELEGDFRRLYDRRYGHASSFADAQLELVSFEVRGVGHLDKPQPAARRLESSDPSAARKGSRQVYLDNGTGYQPVDIYTREKLRPGNLLAGPAVIEAVDTTVFVNRGQQLSVDEYLNLVMRFD